MASPVSSGTFYISYVFNMSGNPGGSKVGLEMNPGGNGMLVGATTPVTGAGGDFVFDELRLATTWAEAVTYTIPVPSATGLSATPGGNSVSLSWTAVAGSPVSYNIKRPTTSGSGYVTVSSPGAVTGTAYTGNVVGGTTYYYVVSAVNAGGESGNSAEASASPKSRTGRMRE